MHPDNPIPLHQHALAVLGFGIVLVDAAGLVEVML